MIEHHNHAVIGAPKPWQMGFQEAVTPVQERLEWLYNDVILLIIIAVCLFVLVLIGYICFRFRESRNPIPSKRTHNIPLEVIWTVIPFFLLLVIAIPSFKTLYFMDKAVTADMTLKITGFQWAWEYSYPDNSNINFESYMIPENELKSYQLRLLSTDNPVVLPVNKNIKLLVTSRDVIHSWAMPSWGIKKDAIPGKLNETWANVRKEGVYFGQCSELCGSGHAFMPAEVWVVSDELFAKWAEIAVKDVQAAKKFLEENWELAPK